MLGDITIRDWWELVRRPPHWQMRDNVVQVRVTPEVFASLDTMGKVTAETLGRLGCPGCHSGFDIRYVLERDFRVTPQLEVVPETLR